MIKETANNFEHVQYTSLEDELDRVSDIKGLASVHQLKSLLGDKCRTADCSSNIIDIKTTQVGYCIKLKWCCENGHEQMWYSSRFYSSGLDINYATDTALILSGGQLNQFHRFCTFLNIGTTSVTEFYANQRLYVSPVVQQCYDTEVDEVMDVM